jgi:FAD:protein FMN transferase
MGCFVEVAVIGSVAESQLAINRAFERLELIQKLLSFHDPNSDLSRLNSAQGSFIECHPLSIRCLRLARAVTRVSDGRFNCTLGGAVMAIKVLPDHDYQNLYGDRVLNYGDWTDIELIGHTARLRRPVLITLDGIAKGFAVDSAVEELKRLGIAAGWINAGGDIRVFGDCTLPISVRDHQGEIHAVGGLKNAAIATSTSISSSEFPGVLLNETGNPIPAMTSCIIAQRAWRADALTKVAALMPIKQRADYVAQFGGRWIPV